MKCYSIALLLPLVLTGRTTGVLAANHQPTVASQPIPAPLAWPESLRQVTSRQSPVRSDADLLSADVFSQYDTYYANGLYSGNREGNPLGKDGPCVDNDDANGATKANTYDVWSIGARWGWCVHRYVPQLAIYGKTAVNYASQHWNEAAAFVHELEKDRTESELVSHSKLDCRIEDSCVGPRGSALASEAPAPRAARHEPAERLYVIRCDYNNRAILATLGKATPNYRQAPSPYATLLGEFYQIDDEACPAFVASTNFAALSQARNEEHDWGEKDGNIEGNVEGESHIFANAKIERILLTVTGMDCWARWWQGDWGVVFRNISRQIAGLDWTVLVTGKPSKIAAHKTAPAANAIER
jgi:hypothetical protein